MSSPTSPVTPAQIIDQILSTDTSTPDYLQQLVTNIDTLLDHYTSKGKQRASDNKMASVRAGLSSPSQVAIFSEEASNNIRLISTQISDCSGDKHSTAISVLNAIGNVHWVGVGFLLVAAVIERLDKIKQNKEERLGLLKSMNDLAKLILQLQCFPHLKKEMQDKMKESIQLIVDGAILCCVQKKRKLPGRLWVAGMDGEELGKLRGQVDEMGRMLHSQITLSTLDVVHNNMVCSRPPVPSHNSAAVGIDHKITEVIELLEWDNDKPAVAVVAHGIGGAGKTTLANEVFASLNLQGWKYSKVTLIKNLELNPNIEEIQSQILRDLTGIKHDRVRDFWDGQKELKSIIEKEVVLIYIDNVLRREHLERLLPKLIDSPKKKVRILVTARKTNISGVFESCGIKPCKLYSIELLSVEAALEVLYRKIDGEKDIDSIVEERPQAKEIAEKCSCCPLFLEVVGAYLHKRNNKVEAYEKVVGWLSDGEDFSCDKEDSFEDSRILFAYNELTLSAQEAFLDICSFFYDWEWNEVACIVGEEELDCLLDGALVKRIEVEAFDGTTSERISIHDLILTAGRNRSKASRFRDVDDFSMAAENKLDLHQTKGVWLQGLYFEPFHVSAKALDTMSRSLRVFAMGSNTIVKGQCRKRFDELRFLQTCHVPNLGIDMLKLNNLRFMDHSFMDNEICSLPKNFSGLQVLKLKRSRGTFGDIIPKRSWGTYGGNIHADIGFGHLIKLKHLELEGFHNTEVSSFVKVYGLQKLKLSGIEGLEELPRSIRKLRSLQELHLCMCSDLMRLGEGFGELSSLTKLGLVGCRGLEGLPCEFQKLLSLQSLNLSSCSSLVRLPEGLENLPSLKYINVQGCTKLISLPNRVCKLSFQKNTISFSGISSLKEVPEEICKFTTLTSLSLNFCKSLKVLPVGFCQLSCLEKLDLGGCESLQELCDDFHCLAGLRRLYMSGCKNLSRLPEGFGKLGCLERLELSRCDNIQELCSDFGCLGALKYLILSKCKSLSKLPDCFGRLGCLETLDLSMCSNLEELSSDFHCLSSLIELELSNCERLGEKWMDNAGSIQSLWRLNISRSEKMIRRWREMQREKEDWNFVVLTDSSWEETDDGQKALMLKVATLKIFDEGGLLIDIHGHPLYSFSLPPASSLIFITDADKHSHCQIDGNLFEKNMQQLDLSSKAWSIIYAGRYFSELPSEVTNRIVAYTPSTSKSSLFFDKVYATFPEIYGRHVSVYSSRGCSEVKGIKCSSVWEDVSYMLNEAAFLLRTPNESNVEILRAILQTDFLLKNNQKVNLMDLQGKVILLLRTSVHRCKRRYLAFNDIYMKIQSSHHNLVEVVWVPDCDETDRDLFDRVAADAPWPVVPNPWLIQPSLLHFFSLIQVPLNSWCPTVGIEAPVFLPSCFLRLVVVVDGKGRISNKNAWEMIERWGEEAFPFSQSREEELRKSEWEKIVNCNQFVFQNLPFTRTEVTQGLPCGELMLLFVGRSQQMLELSANLDFALTLLKSHFKLYYIFRDKKCFYKDEKKKIKRKCSIPSISVIEAYRFWERIKYLNEDLKRMGSEERIVQVRRMVCGIISAEFESRREEIQVIVVDEKGEMVSGRGEQVVWALFLWAENYSKLPTELKMEGIKQVLQRQRKNRIIHSKYHPQHLMLPIYRHYAWPRCTICYKKSSGYFQCTVCENFVMCYECMYGF